MTQKFDTIIIGAGIAGLCSALTSVKYGMKTALVEKYNYMGGIAQDCFHIYICGLFQNNLSSPFQIANPGICSDIFQYLHNIYGDKALVKIGKVETMAFIQKDLWHFFSDQFKKYNVTFFKQSKCTNYIENNNHIQNITITTDSKAHNPKIKKDKIDLEADSFIDATGDSFFSDKTFDGDSQLGGYCFLLKGSLQKDLSLVVPYTARKIVEKYNLNDYLKFITIGYNFLTKHHVLKFSVKTHHDKKTCLFIFEKLNQNIEELSILEFIKSSDDIHLRVSKNTRNYNLADTNTCYSESTESSVKSYWPIEKWDSSKGTRYEYLSNDKPFCIPDSALKDKKIDNLFFAGKNIRVDQHMQASTRVMGVCMATGEKAMVNAFKYLQT